MQNIRDSGCYIDNMFKGIEVERLKDGIASKLRIHI